MTKWVYVLEGEPVNVFENRKAAVKFFLKMLEQTAQDFQGQAITDEYYYSIKIPAQEFKPLQRGVQTQIMEE